MWYFTWILGIGVALAFGIINVMWLDANGKFFERHAHGAPSGGAPSGADATDARPSAARDDRS